jgi:di/tricarboxylate transporter
MLAGISLGALILIIIIGIIKPKVNLGLLAIGCAYGIGVWLMGMKEKELAILFPASLFLMLTSMTYLFALANENKTLQQLTNRMVRLVRGKPTLLPLIFFGMSFALAAAGPGNIAAVALMAPVGMIMAYQTKQSLLLMAIMICTGANSGAFSPIAPTGIIATGILHQINMNQSNLPWIIFAASAAIQSITAFAAFFLFSFLQKSKVSNSEILSVPTNKERLTPFTKNQKFTLVCLSLLLLSIIIFKLPLVLAACIAFVPMVIFNLADSEAAIKKMPWDAILLVTGISLLVSLLEKSGGITLATTLLVSISKVSYINAMLAFITGIISAYSSSSGVVLPAFLPLVPKLIEQLGGGDGFRMAIAIAVGSHMVDVSPLSTLGAICISSVPAIGLVRNRLFRQLMIWGLSMSVVGAFLSYILLDLTY